MYMLEASFIVVVWVFCVCHFSSCIVDDDNQGERVYLFYSNNLGVNAYDYATTLPA